MKKKQKNRMKSWNKCFSKGLWKKVPDALREQFWALPLEERIQLAPQFAEVAYSLGLTDDGLAAIALVSEDGSFVAEQTKKLASYVGERRFKVARLCDNIRENNRYRQLHGCGSASAYLRNTDARLGMSASAFSFLAASGKGYRLFGKELLEGIDGEAGVDESVLWKSLAKLAIYPKIRKVRTAKEALRGFKAYSFQKFRRFEFTDDPDIIHTAKDFLAEMAAFQNDKVDTDKAPLKRRKLPSLDEIGPRSQYELAIRRIIARGGQVHILSSSMPEALEEIDSRLDHWRQSIDEGNRLHFRKQLNSDIEGDILESKVALDIEDYIRAIHSGIAADRRTLAVLVARLRDEPFFFPRWHNDYNSFAAYADQVLGIGEELRDLIRIGRNLIRFPSFLEGQSNFGTDAHFYSLRYLDQAMAKHSAQVGLIRTRLRALTTREFAEFARDPYYDQRGSTHKLTSKKEERVTELLCEVNNFVEQGHAVKIIELLDEKEVEYLSNLLSATENTLQVKAMAAELIADNKETPTSSAEPTLALAPSAQSEAALDLGDETQLDKAA